VNSYKNSKDDILNLCAEQWIIYCGISKSIRTLYWDIAISLIAFDTRCDNNEAIAEFETIVKSCENGTESIKYDIAYLNCDDYIKIKSLALSKLLPKKQKLLNIGFELLLHELKQT